MDPVRIGLYAMPAFLVLMAVEFLSYYFDNDKDGSDSVRRRAGISWRDTGTNLSIYVLGFVLRPLDKFIAVPMVVIAAAVTPLHLSASHWWVWVLAIVLADLAYYLQHRMSHRIRLFWAAHNVHHSSQYFNLSTATRLSWLIPGSFLNTIGYAGLALIGIPAWLVFLSQSIVLLYQFPIHTERIDRLPRVIEFVFNTPSHHRVHHGANNPYLDKNYAGIFILWDRIFGTFVGEGEPVRYGLTKNIDTYNPIKVNYHEFIAMVGDVWRARSWRGRLGYLFGPPGWSENADTPKAVEAYAQQAPVQNAMS
ncbi:sterol desaturase family protein [Mycolicibacterium porcinum]|uniref:Sterol desaturase family protein n=1 Tax=Mycolicibacterium porcinum TaxID=39693 RepID=A0AAW5T680_9MYCO|nr:sterol desaturase family protein [Mycolicibacterium porcinum]MCV7390173.1 sterol desaturase family protein [Mycolicibacterium porcinum]ORB37581.1 C-5 sterol desaturase [Mycolicibacterium porcinum]CDO30015.1 C-5 sterol desaturase [Mycolicibacterium vulneris]